MTQPLFDKQNLPLTETNNANTRDIDALDRTEMLKRINAEDATVAQVVAAAIPEIAQAVDAIVLRMRRGGRLIYVGAGTSGRLGVVDASEMPPTFSVPHGLVVGLIAGGREAMFTSLEGAEDEPERGAADLQALAVGQDDCVVGIAASGRTPYVVGALGEANARGALTISLACTGQPAPVHGCASINIALLTGAEVLTGSTRLKAGTATKLALNMMSTSVMIQLGKTFGNLMVDVQPSNVKLKDRARRIIEAATGVSADEAQRLLDESGEVKTAIVCGLKGISVDEARARLRRAGGRVREALRDEAV